MDAGAMRVHMQPCLTVPLLCCGRGFEVEGCHQVEGRLAQAEVFDGGPQVDDIALPATRRMEALKDVLVQVDAEGQPWLGPLLGMEGTGSLALAAGAPQVVQEPQGLEDAHERQPGVEVLEVDPGPGSIL